MKQVSPCCLLLLFVQLITGCGSARFNFGPANNATLTPTPPAVVKVFKAGNPPDGAYEVVAAISSLGNGNNNLEELKMGAGKMGADAIIGYHDAWGPTGEKNWAQSGIAVRLNSAGSNGERQVAKSGIAVVPFIEIELAQPDIFVPLFRRLIENEAEFYFLFNRGYNAIYADMSLPSGKSAPKAVTFDLLKGKEAYLCEWLLVLRLTKTDKNDLGLLAIGHYAMTAELISKETGETVWRETATKAKVGATTWANSVDTDLVGLLVDKALRNLPKSH
jgi:hypothetical protein